MVMKTSHIIQEEKKRLLTDFSDQVFACLQGKISHPDLMLYAQHLNAKREAYNDTKLSKCMAMVDFIGQQLEKGNIDMHESYLYMIETLHQE